MEIGKSIRKDKSVSQYGVNINAIQSNVQIIQNLAGSIPVWAVLKGNGYGLGLLPMARLLYREGIRRFCISDVQEAKLLSGACLESSQILMLQPTQNPEILKELLGLPVICTVSCLEDAQILNLLATQTQHHAQVHLKIDTGMGRYGFRPDDVNDILSVCQLAHLHIGGIYTHFASGSSLRKTEKQYRLFLRVIEQIRKAGFDPGECHCCNSTAFLNYPEFHLDGVRIGSAFLGRTPEQQKYGLKPVSFCQSRIEEIQTLRKGQASGYAGAWKARKDTRLAMIPVGWYHGFGVAYNRDIFRLRDCIRGCLSWAKAWVTEKRLWVTVNGCRCPVCGHIGMLYTAVDVSDIFCEIGDPVILDISPLLQKGLPLAYQYEEDFTQI